MDMVFPAAIVGVARAGLFVSLLETGAQGFIPKNNLKNDIFFLEEEDHRLVGRRTKTIYRLGDRLEVRLQFVDVAANNLVFEVAADAPSGKPQKKYVAKPSKAAIKRKNRR